MIDPHRVNYLIDDGAGDAVAGVVRADPAAIIWNGGMLAVALIAGPMTATPAALALFAFLTAAALLLGHSVGYHRLMIHGSFDCPPAIRRVLIWCGSWVGMAGPLGIIRTHDSRDWAQRQASCHPYFAHRAAMLRDAWWQIYGRIALARPPRFDFSRFDDDRFIHWLERWWRWQQLPVALLLYALGGWGWVVWGVSVRVAVATHGHWLVGHLAHRRGPQSWLVDGAGVQAYDVPWAAWLTFGEAWHNNHHAYPGSARIGFYPGQSDGGWWLIRAMERLGLAWDVRTPETMGERAVLRAVRKPPAEQSDTAPISATGAA